MIKGLAGARGVFVNGGNTGLQYINQNSSNPMQGMIRVWGTDLQVFDGSNWCNINSSYATIELDSPTQAVLEWAKKKMTEEQLLLELPDDSPAVKLARQNINRIKQDLAKAEEQLKITEILSKDEKTTS